MYKQDNLRNKKKYTARFFTLSACVLRPSALGAWVLGVSFLFILYWPIRWWANEFHLLLFFLVIVFGIGVRFQNKKCIKVLVFTCLLVSLMWMVTEYAFLISNRFVPSHTTAKKTFSCGPLKLMNRKDVELGYRGVPGPIVCSSKLVRGPDDVQLAEYTLDKYGFRVTPGVNTNGKSLVFFGDSNTVGELVNDNQTLPYYVSERLEHRFNVVNLGWSGWGPHQMLRLLELEIVKDVVRGPLRGAVFKTAIWHTQWVLGYAPWDQKGPKYRRQANGDIIYSGPFKSEFHLGVEKLLKKSPLINWMWEKTQIITVSGMELYVDVIVKSAALLQQQYEVPLTILFLPSPGRPDIYGGYTDETVIQRLRQEGLTVLKGSEVVNYRDPAMEVKGDGHSSPMAYYLESKLVASFFQQQFP